MTTFEHDSRFIETSLPQLQDYLLSDELYWPLDNSLPRLTLGALLLALRRVEAIDPSVAYRWQRQMDPIRTKWQTAWEKKALKEIKNRLRLWSASIAEWQSASAMSRADYPGEVRGRVILQILLKEVDAPQEEAALNGLDHFLRASLRKCDFLWGSELEAAFPEDNFWFLYGKLTQ